MFWYIALVGNHLNDYPDPKLPKPQKCFFRVEGEARKTRTGVVVPKPYLYPQTLQNSRL